MTAAAGGNFYLDDEEIDMVMAAVQRGENDPRYNFTDDEALDQNDVIAWIETAANTYVGDANLDGEFNTEDFVQIFQAGTYENDKEAGWATGDWSGDRRFSSEDLVRAFASSGYEAGPRMNVLPVPEPATNRIVLCFVLALGTNKRRTDSM